VKRACSTWLGACASPRLSAPAFAQGDADSTGTLSATADSVATTATPAPALRTRDGLEPLVPALAGSAIAMEPGVRPYVHRLSLGTGFGGFGTDRLFFFRIGYNPNSWLGYEASVSHIPSQSVQAIIHTFNVLIRHPLPGRLQPYLTTGYGMTIVLPGKSVNADAVTKNTLTLGGGIEMYIRGDLALRAEMRGASPTGKQLNRDGVVTYGYREQTIGLAHRQLSPADPRPEVTRS
jgi:hypothetical protein